MKPAPATWSARVRDWLGGRAGLRWFLRHALVLGALAGVAGAFVVAFGLFNVSARAGHWPLTRWVLHTTYRNSVALRARSLRAPDLSDPRLAQLGAAHYERACSGCHGRPGMRQGAVPRAMEPRPPHIAEAVRGWAPNELAWIVGEGVKMTGMPHWPARSRPDEVWPVVAFLSRVPGMGRAEYRLLAQGEAARAADAGSPVTDAVAACTGCHGLDGAPVAPGAVPRLDGQSPRYLRDALRAYARGERDSGFMSTQVVGMDDGHLQRLARYYAAQPSLAIDVPIDPRLLARGRAVAKGDGGRNPRCRGCHGPGASPRNPAYPVLAGEHPAYLERQLRLFKAGTRGGGPHAHLMARVSHQVEDADIRAVAQWYAAQPRGIR